MRLAKLGLVALGLAAAAACQDELPTVIGGDPQREPLTTVELILPADRFVEEIGEFTDYTGPRDASFLLVANQFDGTLEAHTLARFTDFPRTVTFNQGGTSQTDSSFVFGSGRIVARVDTAASSAAGPVTLQLWSLAQAWDPESVSWELAVDSAGTRVPWTQPGGTRAQLLAEVTRAPGDTLTRDSVVWAVDSLTVAAMADSAFPGLLVTASGIPARVQLGPLALRTSLRPAARSDTAVAQSVTTGPQTFIFTPVVPPAPLAWEVGGIGSARTLLRLSLPQTLPTCSPGGGTTNCGTVPLRDVTLNEATLVLNPVQVDNGFRPLVPLQVVLRIVAEPELGRLAPLGSRVAVAQVPADRFAAASDSTVALVLTEYLQRSEARDTTVTVALLNEPEAASFGLARFHAVPQLRLVYTLPLTSRTR